MKEIGIYFGTRITPESRKSRRVEYVLSVILELCELAIFNFKLCAK